MLTLENPMKYQYTPLYESTVERTVLSLAMYSSIDNLGISFNGYTIAFIL